jgi:hypothetical protein
MVKEMRKGILDRFTNFLRGRILRKYAFSILSIFILCMALNFVTARAVNCSDNPTALWDFEESNGIYTNDSCNQNYVGTIYGYPDWIQSQGIFGSNALNFQYNVTSGTNYADFGYILQDTYQNYSISLWVKRNGINEINSDQRIFELGTYWAGTHIEMTMMGFEYSEYTDTGFTGNVMLSYAPNITNGEWDNLITTFNGTDNNLSTYMNGEIIGSIIASTNSITIGETLLMSASHWDWNTINASIDNIAFFNRTLTPEEISDFSSCISEWYCNNFTNNCTNYWNGCTEVKDRTCGRVFTGDLDNYKKPCGEISSYMLVNQYPYIDCNTSYSIAIYLEINGTRQRLDSLFIDIANQTFNFTWNNGTQEYEINLLFSNSEVGDYPYTIWNDYPLGAMENITGTFLVRCPFTTCFKVFELDPKNSSNPYKNIHAYMTAEFESDKAKQGLDLRGRSPYDKTLEQYVTPLGFKELHSLSVFHAPYVNGEACLKLYEKDVTYALRLLDGEMTFPDGDFSSINITRMYGTNIFLGTIYLNGTNETYEYYLTAQEMHPYTTLFNWLLFIGLLLVLGISFALAIFVHPIIAYYFGIVMSFIIIVLRIIVWFSIG